MAKVYFIDLPFADKTRYVCQLAEKYYLSGKRVLIYIRDEQEAARMDKSLWNWKDDSFIPHIISRSPDLQPEEPILISDNCRHSDSLFALILYHPTEPDAFPGYKHVIDFAETHDPQKRLESRSRYKAVMEKDDQTVSFIKLNELLQTALE